MFNVWLKVPLRTVLVVPFVLQIFVAVGLTGYLSLRNGQKAVNEVATQLRNEITSRIYERVFTFIETPQRVTQINVDAIYLGQLNLQDSRSVERHLWHQMKMFNSLNPIAFGTERGEIRSVDRLNDGSLVIRVLDQSTGGDYHTYTTDNQGNRAQLIRVNKTFDPRTRPWYRKAVKAGKPTWTEIYPYFSSLGLAISASRPLYDAKTNNLIGVTNATLSLSKVGEFLRGLKIGRAGQTFIVERTGNFVACSIAEMPLRLIQEGNVDKKERLPAIASRNRVTRLTTQHLIERFGSLSQIDYSQQLDFKIEGKRHFVQVTPFADSYGLDWLIVVVLPEADFMEQIEANTRTTILLCSGALVLATGMGWITSRWITRPILRLSSASQAIASGQLDQRVAIQGINELEVLAQAHNQMATQLQESFAALEKANEDLELRVEERTAELQEAKAAAEAANKAKSEFLANMSHELRTPLNGILGYAQILQNPNISQEKQLHGIQIIYQCGSHLLSVINDILDVAKIEAEKMELYPQDFHFPAFLQGIVEICRIWAQQKGLAFVYQLTSDLPVGVHADEKRLRQVLINLLSNAIKFTETGRILFTVGVVSQEPFENPASAEDNHSGTIHRIRFQIEDTGVGIHPNDIERIFLPFEQVGVTVHKTQGTGLGLPISQKIVQLMGSTLCVSSQLGMGSVFWFNLDLLAATEWTPPSQVATPGIVGFTGRKRKILVVDDRWENRLVLVNFLEPLGFEVIQAVNGQEGLNLAATSHPDLIIIDLVMPVIDGFEMVRRIRQSALKDVVVITSSANVLPTNYEQSLAVGANDFLPKPLLFADVLEKLQRYLGLEWIYAEPRTTDWGLATNQNLLSSSPSSHSPSLITPPPPEEIAHLYELAIRGNIKGILRQATFLEQLDEQLIPFAERLRQLARGFQEEEILEFINQYRHGHL